jgi:hypothetical protein
MIRKALCGILAAIVICLAAPSQATILLFANLGLSNYGNIPGSYGDNVNSDNGGQYAMGTKWTKRVTTSYAYLEQDGVTVVGNQLDYWSTGYGNLTDIAFSPVSGKLAEITFKADPGYLVKIVEFDLGAYGYNHFNQPVRIVNGNRTTTLEDFGPLDVPTGATHNHIMTTIGYKKKLRLQWSNDWNLGIDNVHFIQKASARVSGRGTPEPGTWALLVGALVPAAALLRRARR